MGLPWIAVAKTLPQHPKSMDLSESLGEPLAWARMVAIWLWASDYAPDGIVACKGAERALERAASWTGEPGRLVAAAVDAGFIERDGEALVLHGWDDYQGGHRRKAEADAERLRRKRESDKAARATRTKSDKASHPSRDESDKASHPTHVRGEERRVQETQDTHTSTAAVAATTPEPAAPHTADAVAPVLAPIGSTEQLALPVPSKPSDVTVDAVMPVESARMPVAQLSEVGQYPDGPQASTPPQKPAHVIPATKAPAEKPEALQAAWNLGAHPDLPRWREMTPGRKSRARDRLTERPLDEWREVIARISASPFCRGGGPRGWRADPDWLLKAGVATSVLEGKFDDTKPAAKRGPVGAEQFVGKHVEGPIPNPF